MSGEHKGVKAYFEKNTPDFTYIHCRNHGLVLCFAHLLPLYEDFAQFIYSLRILIRYDLIQVMLRLKRMENQSLRLNFTFSTTHPR